MINSLREAPLGALIVQKGLASDLDVTAALAEARRSGRRLGEVLVARCVLSERDLALLLAEQEDLSFVDLGKFDLDPRAVEIMPEATARCHAAAAYAFDERAVLVAVADPTDDAVLDAVLQAAGPRHVRFVVATRSEIDAALAEAYGTC